MGERKTDRQIRHRQKVSLTGKQTEKRETNREREKNRQNKIGEQRKKNKIQKALDKDPLGKIYTKMHVSGHAVTDKKRHRERYPQR